MSAWGSPWYRVWVIGGLLVIVGVSIGLGLANPTDQRVIFAILPMLAIYMGGIFVMQARAATRPEATPMSTRAEEPASGADPPKGWNELTRVLAVKPIDPAAERAARRASGGVWLSQVRLGAVLTALILVGVGLFYGGVDATLRPFGDSGPGLPVVFLPIFALIVFAVLRIPFTIRQSVSASDAYLEPLGLRVTETPKVGVRPRYGGSGMQSAAYGPTVMSGTRHGRKVRIELEGSEYETTVSGRTPSFSVAGADGRLATKGDAPAAVKESLEPLSADPRWREVEVEGGADGIAVRRRLRGSASTEALWMDDLWLAERLADAVRPSRRRA